MTILTMQNINDYNQIALILKMLAVRNQYYWSSSDSEWVSMLSDLFCSSSLLNEIVEAPSSI